ncbi:MAG: TonB-dependent receptor [Rhodoferax sp.]|uniref:TonB-dependent receptor n=1 Tax=Rhodoferax sp. TaxID=50421 RepID=UPI003017EAFA
MRKNSIALGVSFRLLPLVGALALIPYVALAQGIATEAQLKPVSVTESRAQLDPNLPNSTASKTARDLEEQNLFNPEDALRYLPSTTVRKRYFGDRNANVGGRSFGVLEPGRALVYVDGYLISTFMGRFDAPRWYMINNEAIERVDMLYGPYSAIYPGNSIGTTVSVTERKPQGFEASASLKYNRQSFSEYGTSDSFEGVMASARLASKLDSGLWYSLGLQHQDVTGHPMGFANVLRGATGQFSPTLAGTRVTGIAYDKDPSGVDRALFGATSIDHTVQDTMNLRLGYALSATQEIEGRVSYWQNKSTVTTQTYLKDANGNPVWSGLVNDGVKGFNLAAGNATTASPFAPSQRDEDNRQLGFTWKTKHATGWNASVVLTDFAIVNDVNRVAFAAQPVAAWGGLGTATRRDGTGWDTFEVQSTYTPTKGDFGDGKHALTFGLHHNDYRLNNVVNNSTDWRNSESTLNQNYYGKTSITAAYAQDAWQLTPDLMLTAGVRQEQFDSYDGSQFFTGVAPATYPVRSLQATSPKLSLAWAARDDLLLKVSAGQGVRFPNVDELFNGSKTGTSITFNDPNLRPERSTSVELSAERYFDKGTLRASLFRDDVTDTILRQSDATVTPSVTRVSNVDRVVTNGLELAWQSRDVGIKGLDLSGNATWVDSRVAENAALPASVGMNWLRIPKQRYTLQTSYRPNDQWLFSGAWRWAGRMYNTQLNTDINPDVYGGTSSVNQVDVHAAWHFSKEWTWSAGIDNLTNAQAWQAHSLPQRSIQTELRYSLK